MNQFNGSIFGGDFLENTFYLTRVKHLDTASNISSEQMKHLYQYLMKYSEQDESCTITVNDQMPILLNADEVHFLQNDLSELLAKIDEKR
ncbi:hypothetical protein [Aquibacillus albus]|uniref:Uncharacterized protein n=1 Tax=Aquibacillus albus TaxID=1168171 RepID=A0ABS2MYY1_9BACI|nr:hypothetical protein [Aquibacillus albus]MBM7571013.1 hypothetical protein [Aquibacillus albus]